MAAGEVVFDRNWPRKSLKDDAVQDARTLSFDWLDTYADMMGRVP